MKRSVHQRVLVSGFLALALLSAIELLADGGETKSVRVAMQRSRMMTSTSETEISNTANTTSTPKSTAATPVPRILHFMVLGESPPEYMIETARVNMDRVSSSSQGFTTKLWLDKDVERLITKHGDKKLIEAWEYAKSDKTVKRNAKMADFMRILIMYKEGGVYLDADMIPCEGVDFMVDKPGVVSFPWKKRDRQSKELNGAAMSSPPGHLLMKMTLEYFKRMGKAMRIRNNLMAAGPRSVAIVADWYFAEVFGTDELPSLYDGLNIYEDMPDDVYTVTNDNYWTQIADIRFSPDIQSKSMFHVGFNSWFNGYDEPDEGCYEDTSKIKPWIESSCAGVNGPDSGMLNKFSDCGTYTLQQLLK